VILITGGTGFIGRALIQALAPRGQRMAVLTRDPARLSIRTGQIAVRQGDVLDPRSLVAALEGITTIIHLAAALPDSGLPPSTAWRINVEGSTNLARAAAQHDIAQFVHGSSAGVYGDGFTTEPRRESSPLAPRTWYEQSKAEAERAIAGELSGSSVAWTVLRSTGVHGPGRLASARFYRRIRRRPVWVHGPATVIVHPTSVHDVVAAIGLTIGRTDLGGEVINIAGPRALTYPDLIALVASRMGVRVSQFQVPGRLARILARLAPPGSSRGRGLERFTRAVVNRSLDTGKAERLIGYAPYPLDAGIDETIAWARRERLL
jgi:nucleoside-diphosphate-sugar epimerase